MSYLVLTEEFPINYKPTPVNANQPAKIESTTLSSGAKLIVSEKYAKRVSLEIAVQGGSSTETPAQKGAAHFLASAAFLGNQKNTGVRLVRHLESLGASFSAHADREKIVYRVSALPDKLEQVIGGVVAAISSAPYADHVYEEHREEVARLYEEALSQPATHVDELVHEAAFGAQSGMGQSLFASQADSLSVEEVQAYRAAHFTRENLAISVDGASAAHARQLLEQALDKVPSSSGSRASAVASSFVGGEVRVRNSLTAGQSEVALAFAVPKGEQGKAHEVLARTLSSALRAQGVAAQSFFFPYAHGGLFGVRLSGTANAVNEQLAGAAEVLKSLRTVDATRAEALKKKAAIQKLLAFEGHGRTGALLDSLLIGSGNANSHADLRAVSHTDLQKAATEALKSQPAYVVFGQTQGVHSLAAVQKLLN